MRGMGRILMLPAFTISLMASSLMGDGIKYIAHRGKPFEQVENTLNSFSAAAKDKRTWGLEMDVKK